MNKGVFDAHAHGYNQENGIFDAHAHSSYYTSKKISKKPQKNMKSYNKKIFLEDFWAATPTVRWLKSGKMVQNNARAQPVQLRVHTVPIGALKYDYRSEI